MIQSSGSRHGVEAQRRKWACPRLRSQPAPAPALIPGLMLPFRQVPRALAFVLSGMGPSCSVAVSLAPAPHSALMPSCQPSAGKEDLPAKTRLHAPGSCPTSFLLGASCLELGSSPGPPIFQGSIKGDASLCVTGLHVEESVLQVWPGS